MSHETSTPPAEADAADVQRMTADLRDVTVSNRPLPAGHATLLDLDRHLTPDSNKNSQVPRTVNTHTELTGGPAYPDCRPPPGRSVTDSQSLTAALLATREPPFSPSRNTLEV